MALTTFPDTGDLISEDAWQALNRLIGGGDWIGQYADSEADIVLAAAGRILTVPAFRAMIGGVYIAQDAAQTLTITGAGGYVYLSDAGALTFRSAASTSHGALVAEPVVTGAAISDARLRLFAARYPAHLISVVAGGTLEAALAARLPLAGGTMTGALSLPAPTDDAHAANKAYVDEQVDNARKPHAPLSLAAATPALSQILITWRTPTTGGVVTGYQVRYRQTGASAWTTADVGYAATRREITGLANATEYEYAVRAVNAAGEGPWAAGTIRTQGLPPDPPSNFRVTAQGNGNAVVEWDEPDGVLERQIQFDLGGPTISPLSPMYTFSGLFLNQLESLRGQVRTANGWSGWSSFYMFTYTG